MRFLVGSRWIKSLSLTPVAGAIAFMAATLTPQTTQTAIANGDTRTITLFHAHRKDTLTVTFRVNGSYDQAALNQLNYFLRDWRNDQQTRMDPRLFDVIWDSYRSVHATGPIMVLSAYRSPTTNAMLRTRSRAVAKNSQHMAGKAMDMRFSGVNMHRVREVAIRFQRGGVGWYGSSNFVHLDVGSVRAWPRLSYAQLASLFPDGKTVHIAADGRTLPGYEEARALIASRGDYVPTLAQVREKSFLARLFGWDEDDEADQRSPRGAPAPTRVAAARGGQRVAAATPAPATAYAPTTAPDDGSAAAFFRNDGRSAPAQTPAAQAPVAVAALQPPALRTTRQPTGTLGDVDEPTTPAPAVPALKGREVNAPLPPPRPSETVIAALVERAQPAERFDASAPLPPVRPPELLAKADTPAIAEPAAPLPPLRTAALTPGKSALPDVITRGTPAAAGAAPVGLLAYAVAFNRLIHWLLKHKS